MQETLDKLTQSIKIGKRKDAIALTKELIGNVYAGDILNALLKAMDYVGKRFKANEIFVPEVLIAARAMKSSMQLLEPELTLAGLEPEHCIVIGTVEGDLHDIGKNLVTMMLKGANFKVIDLGVDINSKTFIDAVVENKANILCLSALLTTTMGYMQEVINELKNRNIDVKVMIGGAPITQDYADKIGANGYSTDAASAVELAKKLIA